MLKKLFSTINSGSARNQIKSAAYFEQSRRYQINFCKNPALRLFCSSQLTERHEIFHKKLALEEFSSQEKLLA